MAEHASEAGRTQPETLSPADMTEGRIDLGRRLAAWRRAAGLTQARLGQFTSYARSSIANVEIGRQCPPRVFWQRCDRHLAAGGALLVAFDQAQAALPQAQRSVPTEPVGVYASQADLAPQTFPVREPVPVGRSEADADERYAARMLDGRTAAAAPDNLVRGMTPTTTAPSNPGNIRASTDPGAVHFE